MRDKKEKVIVTFYYAEVMYHRHQEIPIDSLSHFTLEKYSTNCNQMIQKAFWVTTQKTSTRNDIIIWFQVLNHRNSYLTLPLDHNWRLIVTYTNIRAIQLTL